MKLCLAYILFALLLSAPIAGKPQQIWPSYPVVPVPFTSVHVTDNFWAPRIRTNHEVTIPIAIEKCRETGRIRNFMIAGKLEKGSFCSIYPFDDSDVYKIIEGASFSLQTTPDPELELTLDTLIYYITLAQEPDGYLYTNRTIDPDHMHEWVGKKRWEKDPELSHELYNLGHLYEAAVAHYQATGKRTLLDVAIKSANLVYTDFIGSNLPYYPGHQVIEMGLVKLYGVTGDQKYLELADYMLQIRHGGEEYNQAHKPVAEQDKIAGHAVRATYMYCGMADVAAINGNKSYDKALSHIWDDLITTKYYFTGGIGSGGDNEGFGEPYFLPNMTAYCETCASIGNIFWNYRMFLLHGESKYLDVLERSLYNAMLAGVSLSGDRFFYPNPLESKGQHQRSAWFGCACCPSNICRFLPSIPGYMYASDSSTVYINLYARSSADIALKTSKVTVSQATDYPWDGRINVTVSPENEGKFKIALRIPGWASGQAVPGNLYYFLPDENTPYTVTVNGKAAKYILRNGYAVIEREWKPGDNIELNLPMPVKKAAANPLVKSDEHKIALQRGPLVYCLEGPDNKNAHVFNLAFDPESEPVAVFNHTLLNGVEVIKGEATAVKQSENGEQYTEKQSFTAIPYFAWANRGAGEMRVWVPTDSNYVQALKTPTLSSRSKVSSSAQQSSMRAVNDNEIPENRFYTECRHFNFTPSKNRTDWIQYDFDKKTSISEASVFWFTEGQEGYFQLPVSWRIVYKSGGKWIPVHALSPYELKKDAFNTVNFKAIKTESIRLEVTLPEQHSSGVYEWMVK